MNPNLFSGDTFTVRQKLFTIRTVVTVLDQNQQPILYCRKKSFKLKEDIRIYTDETRSKEVFRISARNIIDFAATYDIIDSETETKIGSFRRKGLKSILKDEWIILDTQDREVGLIKEDSAVMAIMRRLFTSLIPQSFQVYYMDKEIGEFRRAFNPFVNKMQVDLSADTTHSLDHRMGVAAALLIVLMEARSS